MEKAYKNYVGQPKFLSTEKFINYAGFSFVNNREVYYISVLDFGRCYNMNVK